MNFLSKMVIENGDCARYFMGGFALNDHLGQKLSIEFINKFHCYGCGKEGLFKIYRDGFCGKCIKTLPQCDLCMVKPELCHYDDGSCRGPEWGDEHCNKEHLVYLANTSSLKVGITRNGPTRWLDQGATQVLPIISVSRRYHSGLVEKILAQYVVDKTNWRTMLQGAGDPLDLVAKRDELFELSGEALDDLEDEIEELKFLDDEEVSYFKYPILEYPKKISSLSFEKSKVIEGTLLGIKGQYLIFDTGVFNVRKHSGYGVNMRSN